MSTMLEDSKATILDQQNIASVKRFVKPGILLSCQPCGANGPGTSRRIRVFLNSIDVCFRRPQLDLQFQVLSKPADAHGYAITFLEAVQHRSPALPRDLSAADRNENIALLQASAFGRRTGSEGT